MVSSTHWIASAVGMSVLEAGGNAFDAAAAAGFALQVVEPHLNGLGGEVPIILYSTNDDEVSVVCGQGTAPAAATIDAMRAKGYDLIPGAGLDAACVPGALDGWLTMLERWGSASLDVVLGPAISLARDGYPVVPRISAAIAANEEVFRAQWPSSAAVYLADGVPRPGSLFRNRDLAATYESLLKEGTAAGAARSARIAAARRAFYEGFVADEVDSFVAASDDGFVAGSDLASWRATVEAPVRSHYGIYEVCKAGPWSQGPVFLQQLALLRAVDVTGMGFQSTDHVHTIVEGAKLAFADREAFYGDPNFVDVPLDELLSPAYNDDRRALIGHDASRDLRPGTPGGLSGVMPPVSVGTDARPAHLAGAGEPTRGDTCHVDVVDRWGNMVAATPSGGWLQSSPVIPGLGFCLGTRAQMFWLDPSHPNSLQPGKRPRTTLTPSLALRDGEPYLAFGTPGGDTQDQWSLNFFVAHVHFGLDLQAAIDAPMFHSNHFPSSFWPRVAIPRQMEIEGRAPAATIDGLRRRGHEVVVADDWSLGRLCAVARDGGVLKAAANPRGMQGYAIGR
ncbi:MAG: gamma-glutamyltransferase family protein [Actinomycetota bacterium]|nr:gamma-glutamyltransferase family protein [Actinomycetota bacterium]